MRISRHRTVAPMRAQAASQKKYARDEMIAIYRGGDKAQIARMRGFVQRDLAVTHTRLRATTYAQRALTAVAFAASAVVLPLVAFVLPWVPWLVANRIKQRHTERLEHLNDELSVIDDQLAKR